jgi:hypothetical protein
MFFKKGVKLGSSGSCYFSRVYSTQTAGFNINKSSGKINSYMSYQFTNRNNYENQLDRLVPTDNVFGKIIYAIDVAFTKTNVAYDLRLSYG